MGSQRLDLLFYIDENSDKSDLFFEGTFIPERVKSDLPAVFKDSQVYISCHENDLSSFSEYENIIPRKGIDDLKFWKGIFEQTGADHMAFIHGDSPFFDTEILEEIFELHGEFLAEFTFSENLPRGFACEVISAALLKALPDFEEETLSLSQVIKKNINQFDVELYYKSPDIRDKRLSFRNSSLRDRTIMKNLFEVMGEIPKYTAIGKLIDENPKSLFIGPSYIEVEITGRSRLDCIFSYRKAMAETHGDMDMETLSNLLSGLRETGNKYTICFGGSGDPLEHPDFYAMTELVLKEDLVERIILETDGLLADGNFKNFFEKHRDRLVVIFNMNGYDGKTYESIHGQDFFDSVHGNILALADSDPNHESIYVQVMKINETNGFDNEGDAKSFLDKYYDFWENTSIPIILQKQNTYLGRIEDRRYSDLSPVKRTPCWHLQRDLFVLSDGTVAFCKQDIDGYSCHGKIGSDSLKDILARQRDFFIEDYSGTLCSKPDCSLCDEWYTFNF